MGGRNYKNTTPSLMHTSRKYKADLSALSFLQQRAWEHLVEYTVKGMGCEGILHALKPSSTLTNSMTPGKLFCWGFSFSFT